MKRPAASSCHPDLGQPEEGNCLPAPSRLSAFALVAMTLAIVSQPPECRADLLYGYVDERGVSNFSDAPSDHRHRLIIDTRPAYPIRDATSARRVPASLNPFVRDAARHSRLDASLIEAVAYVESGFDRHARSPKGAMGLMQLMPATAARFGIDNPLDPRQNLLGGARYLRELLDRFESLPLALAAYNAGEGAVQRHGNAIPPYAETMQYVPAVMGHYDRLRRGERTNLHPLRRSK